MNSLDEELEDPAMLTAPSLPPAPIPPFPKSPLPPPPPSSRVPPPPHEGPFRISQPPFPQSRYISFSGSGALSGLMLDLGLLKII